MAQLTPQDAAARIEKYASKGLLKQGGWRGTTKCGEAACLLGAIDPSIKSIMDCPSSVMPCWMAAAVVSMFDGAPINQANPLGLKFAAALRNGRTDNDMRDRWLAGVAERACEAGRPRGNTPAYWPEIEKSCVQIAEMLRDENRDPGTLRGATVASTGWSSMASMGWSSMELPRYTYAEWGARSAYAVAETVEAASQGDVAKAVRAASQAAESAALVADESGGAASSSMFLANFIALITEMTR